MIQENKVSSFQLFNKPLYSSDHPLNVLVFTPGDFDFNPISKIFESTSKNLNVRTKLKVIQIDFYDGRKALQKLEKLMLDNDGTFDNYDLNWFIIPSNFSRYYS